MGTWMLSVSALLAVSSLVSHSLAFSLDSLGFNLADLEKAIRERDTAMGQSQEQTPAGVFADYLIELFDSNSDGEVTLDEVRQRIDRYFEARKARGIESDETAARFQFIFAGPVLTIATLIDADKSGTLERNELERASNTMIKEMGSPVIVAVFTLTIDSLRRREANEGYDITINDEMVTSLTNALDSNDDGAISNAELERLETSRKFRYFYDTLTQKANEADRDGNDSLNAAEIREWLELLNESHAYSVRRLYQLGRVAGLLGRDIADEWLTSDFV